MRQGNFGSQIADFADRAIPACCNQREAWQMLTAVPRRTLCPSFVRRRVLRLSEHQALDLSWCQSRQTDLGVAAFDEIEALTPSIAPVMNGSLSEVRDGVSSWHRMHFPTAHFYFGETSPMNRNGFRTYRLSLLLLWPWSTPLSIQVHIPAFCPDQFTHPEAHTGCFRLFFSVATSTQRYSSRK